MSSSTSCTHQWVSHLQQCWPSALCLACWCGRTQDVVNELIDELHASVVECCAMGAFASVVLQPGGLSFASQRCKAEPSQSPVSCMRPACEPTRPCCLACPAVQR